MRYFILLFIFSSHCLASPLSIGSGQSYADFYMEAALGNIPGYSQEFLIGVNPDIDSGDGELTIWDNKFNLTRLTTYTELFLSSSSSSDTSQTIIVTGLDQNYNPKSTETVLTGQAQVSAGSFIHVQSAILKVGSAALNGDVYVAESDTLTSGAPDTNSKVKSKIIQGNGITRNGFYLVPAGSSAITMAIRGTIDTSNKSAEIKTLITPFGALTPWRTVSYTITEGFPQFLFPAPVATFGQPGQSAAVLPEKTFIEFRASVQQSDTRVFFGSDFLIVESTLTGLNNIQ